MTAGGDLARPPAWALVHKACGHVLAAHGHEETARKIAKAAGAWVGAVEATDAHLDQLLNRDMRRCACCAGLARVLTRAIAAATGVADQVEVRNIP